jgi:Mn2+/Fe2+ NRAMP family transporter
MSQALALPSTDAPAVPVADPAFVAPHPGSQAMPRWDTGKLIDVPRVGWRNMLAMIGPGIVLSASAIGGGEWLLGPTVTAKYGGSLMWLAATSIIFQAIYNIEISRYTLYCGEPIFSGKFRTPPGPWFWLCVYLLFDFSALFPYLAASAAIPVEVLVLGGEFPQHETVAYHWWLNKVISSLIVVLGMLPLIFGGKIYNSLKVCMSLKLVLLFTFLLVLGVLFSRPATWGQIWSGFFKVGNVPVQRGEDKNGNGVLDPGEDWDGDGHLDVAEALPPTIDTNGDGKPDAWEKDAAGKPIKWRDVDGDGKRDGDNVENVFVELFQRGRFPQMDFTLVAFIAGLAAIAGNGGLSNTPVSNYTRDQGWGMGHCVGAIPSMVGGRGISLTHVGAVFEVNEQTLPRWRRWYRHLMGDQLFVWLPACLIGVALPSMLSIEFLPRGTEADQWNSAVMTAEGVRQHVTNPPSGVLVTAAGLTPYFAGPAWGRVFWWLTLLCGFLVLATCFVSTAEGIVRRWVDVFWISSPRLRKIDPENIRYVYFGVLVCYAVFSVFTLWLNKPAQLITWATLGYNFAIGFSCWHTLILNRILLPRELRPGAFPSIALIMGGIFFWVLGTVAVLDQLQKVGLIHL